MKPKAGFGTSCPLWFWLALQLLGRPVQPVLSKRPMSTRRPSKYSCKLAVSEGIATLAKDCARGTQPHPKCKLESKIEQNIDDNQVHPRSWNQSGAVMCRLLCLKGMDFPNSNTLKSKISSM
eukprot:3141083-Amphidinium_carterae.1